mgnify:FL=1
MNRCTSPHFGSGKALQLQFQADGKKEQRHTGVGNLSKCITALDAKPVKDKSGNQLPYKGRQTDPAGDGSEDKCGHNPQWIHIWMPSINKLLSIYRNNYL